MKMKITRFLKHASFASSVIDWFSNFIGVLFCGGREVDVVVTLWGEYVFARLKAS